MRIYPEYPGYVKTQYRFLFDSVVYCYYANQPGRFMGKWNYKEISKPDGYWRI